MREELMSDGPLDVREEHLLRATFSDDTHHICKYFLLFLAFCSLLESLGLSAQAFAPVQSNSASELARWWPWRNKEVGLDAVSYATVYADMFALLSRKLVLT